MFDFLVTSIVASVVLTIALNLAIRLFPGTTRRAEKKLLQPFEESAAESRPRVKVFFPWKAMLAASIVLTIVVNVIARWGR